MNNAFSGSLRIVGSVSDAVNLKSAYGAFVSGRYAYVAGADSNRLAVVDISNPLTADYMGLTIGHSTSAAEEIQKLAPEAHVVKAFNTIFASLLKSGGKVGTSPATVFVAGDNDAANAAVEAIASKAGFKVLQSGGLKVARYLEPVAGLNIVLGYGKGHGTDIAPTWLFAA